MNAKESYIYRFLDGADKKFIIPVYQRPYSWKKQDCELLLSDLIAVYEKKYTSHFFGSIVYVANDVGGCNEYIVIDGQQRITTVSLLLLAIRNYIQNNNLKIGINPRKITNAYLTDEYANDSKKLKLKLVQGDDAAYDRLIEGGDTIENNAVTVNYLFFYNELSKMNNDKIKGLYDAVMKLMIVNISLDPAQGDDPQLIFESLNSTGQDLDEADKIRNYVLMNMSAADQEKFYHKYWEVLEQKVSRNDINKFIRYYLATKNNELPNEKKLYFVFKQYKNVNDIPAEDLLKDILQYADFYKIIKDAKEQDKGYRETLARLNKLEVNSCTPLLFNLFIAYKNKQLSSEELEKACCIIENYIVRRIICGLPTNQINKLFAAIGSEILRIMDKEGLPYYEAFQSAILSKTGRSRFPTDHDFVDKFTQYEIYNARPIVKKYILERLENYGTKEKVAVEEQVDAGTLTIEHIMPQTLTDEWKKELGENWEIVYTKYLNTIGNITLTAYNSDYSNLSFIKKRDMKDKGFKYSKLSLNSMLQSIETWNGKYILERASVLYERAKKIWWMPETQYDADKDEEWIFWDEDYDFTNMMITRIRFLGEEVIASSVSDAYKKLNELFYDLDPVLYSEFNNVNHSTDKTQLRAPAKIGNDMYINTNLSSQAKMDVVEKLAEHYGFSSSDVQFLAREKTNFDIKNPNTYGCLKVGKLAYELIKDLLLRGLLTETEITGLKTKEYSKQVISKIVYPILADNRSDNMGNGSKLRYRKNPVVMPDGRQLYITQEWFDYFREDLLKWYEKHLNND